MRVFVSASVCIYIYTIRESVSGYFAHVFANVLITFSTVLPYVYIYMCVCVCVCMCYDALHAVCCSILIYRYLRIVRSMCE